MIRGGYRIIGLMLALLLASCKQADLSHLSFYYWKTNFQLKTEEKNILKELGSRYLYVRFFDVDIPADTKGARPVGILSQTDPLPQNLEVIPVIFITNRTFIKLNTTEDIQTLAEHIVSKVRSMKGNFSELQFDCDWSLQTKDAYFSFLKEVRKLIPEGTQLTATIRLHQVKYHVRTGIPPVDRGMLMFYNMGSVTDPEEANSIYDRSNAEKYTAYLESYPLQLDLALPIFRWYVHYRDGKAIGLLSKGTAPNTADSSRFAKQEKSSNFRVASSFFEQGQYYKKGDLVKSELLDQEQLLEAAKLLKQSLKEGEKRRVVFYDLDASNIQQYDRKIFEKIGRLFN